ncbi:MAG: ATP-binding cassette domain-containing protein [Alphaproteobacteria bacterium]|nr:ATP-binding cassette domain-containing protein [Alphaproteobacteria bacterium]
MTNPIISLTHIQTRFGSQIVHEDVSFDIPYNQIYGLVGASGSGKSVLLRVMIGLIKPYNGNVTILGKDIQTLNRREKQKLSFDIGVSFQNGALFSSLNVAQNIQMPMKEYLDLPQNLMDELTGLKLALVGLSPDTAWKYPSQLSGGMRKRVGIARALALDPKILLLDEPTAGLDAISAEGFDTLIKALQESLNLTVVIVTHDIDTLVAICDKVAVLVDRKIIVGTIEELLELNHPWINEYFGGMRGQNALIGKKLRSAKG